MLTLTESEHELREDGPMVRNLHEVVALVVHLLEDPLVRTIQDPVGP
jgi:hypothetical protein